MDPQQLERTVDEFNQAVDDTIPLDQTVLDGRRTRGLTPDKTNWARRIESPPYYGIPLTTAVTFTYRGIRTDSRARVLAPGGAPIPNLYAAGEVTGLFYHEYPAATSVLRSLTFGRLAGAEAVAQQS